PEKSSAGGRRCGATARDSSPRRRSWPRMLANAMARGEAAGLDRRPRARLDFAFGAAGVDADPTVGLRREQVEVAVAHPLVELPHLGFQPVPGSAPAHPRQADL